MRSACMPREQARARPKDRKSTRLNSSHTVISYAVFCLKKKSVRVTDFMPPRDEDVDMVRVVVVLRLSVRMRGELFLLFFFNDTATTEIYTLSLHDALPI